MRAVLIIFIVIFLGKATSRAALRVILSDP